MLRQSRRSFLKKVLAGAATVTIAGTKSSGIVFGANDTIRIGLAGLHGRGAEHIKEFAGMKGVQITYLIDPDTRTFDKRVEEVHKKGGNKPETVQDIRKALDDKNLDAISIATPNHWHSLMTIWACQAGKDVYVEKPCSHNIHEGRIAVETAQAQVYRAAWHPAPKRRRLGQGGGHCQVREARQTAGVTWVVLQAARHYRHQAGGQSPG